MSKLLKILVSAYACGPKRGSEPGMGWRFVHGLSKYHELHVIVEQEKWEKEINEYLAEHPNPNLHFYFIRKKRNRALRKIWPPSYYWFYKDWHKKAYTLAKNLDQKENFDLIHQLNMVGYREPGFLYQINKPFIWGPIGGTRNVPWHLFSKLDWYGKLFYGGRNLFNSFQILTLKRPKKIASRQQTRIIAATPDIKEDVLRIWNRQSDIITEVGTFRAAHQEYNIRKSSEPLNIIWTGQHTSGKALNILINSLALVDKNANWKLEILGVGRQTKSWKELAKKKGINQHCVWNGWIRLEDAIAKMKAAHVLCITSLKDLTSTVVMEAISIGLPVICLDHCGFAHVINKNCGIKIGVNSDSNIEEEFKIAIQKLHDNEIFRQQLAKGALERAEEFSWENKIKRMSNQYKMLLHESTLHT
ncbi:MAG: glycosyltransferase family 4 protein [bacterium]